MEISFKKALVSPFNDENWLLKVGIGILLFVPALMVSSASGEKNLTFGILSFIAGFFIAGYSWVVLHNELNNVENVLPDWDFIKIAHLAVQGVIISLGYLLISLPVIAVFIALIIFLKQLVIIFAVIGVASAFFWYLALIPIAQSLFAKDFEFAEAFNFPKVWAIAKKSWKYYLLALFYSFLIGLIFGFSTGFIGGIVVIFNKFLGSFIIQISQILIIIASANLYGQTFKKAAENIEN